MVLITNLLSKTHYSLAMQTCKVFGTIVIKLSHCYIPYFHVKVSINCPAVMKFCCSWVDVAWRLVPHGSPGPRVVGVEILANQVAFEKEQLGQEETLQGLGRGGRGGGGCGLGGGQQEGRHQAGERQDNRQELHVGRGT